MIGINGVAGEAKLGTIYRDELLERWLKIGDVFRIPAGSAFYLVNTGEGQRLHIICSINTSESLGLRTFQVFNDHHPSLLITLTIIMLINILNCILYFLSQDFRI